MAARPHDDHATHHQAGLLGRVYSAPRGTVRRSLSEHTVTVRSRVTVSDRTRRRRARPGYDAVTRRDHCHTGRRGFRRPGPVGRAAQPGARGCRSAADGDWQ
eukprot:749804-Hanusia_phi.AAC.1